MHLIVWLFRLRDERKKMKANKGNDVWFVQIMDLMLKFSTYDYNGTSSGCHPGLMRDFPYRNKTKDEGM